MRKSLSGGIAGLLGLVAWAMSAQADAPTVRVTGGTIAGTHAGRLSVFKGIPFAAPPVGEQRWRAPQPVVSWSGVKPATDFAPACMQDKANVARQGANVAVSEDCLYLNVWTPATSPDEKLPVIVWVYGGGFIRGMTSAPLYDGTNFANRGVVFVSLAYRVGPMGFLATPALSRESGQGSGNYGLLDLVAGLEWVHANISTFGGDPTKVTIFGHSAGAYAVSMLAASPLATGLFRAVIAESGANFGPPQQVDDEGGEPVPALRLAETYGHAFLDRLGARSLAEARALPADAVQAGTGGRFWAPLDGHVVPDDQAALWKAGRFNDVPVLVGSTSDEAASLGVTDTTPEAFEANVRNGYGAKAREILAAYPHATPADATRADKQLRRDTLFGWPAHAWATLQSTHGRSAVYVYYFDRPTPENPDGSGHGSDLRYVFGNLTARAARIPSEDERALSDRMQRYWVNFATHGDPNGPGLHPWPAFTAARPLVMRLGSSEGAVPQPNAGMLQALDTYYAWRRAEK